MKNSGIEWIGEIPDSWTCGKLKYVLQSNDGGVWGSDPLENENDKTVLRSTEQTVDGKWTITNPAKRCFSTDICYYRIIPGDLLITKSSGSALHIGKTTIAGEFFEQKECYYSNFLQRIRLKKNFLPQYAWYILNSIFVREQFAYMQNSTSGLGNITSSNIDNVFIPMPSMNIQQQIVNILDCKTAYIDKLIEVQQAQIEKLKEYKQSVITEAVTKGLDPTAPMKDSGVEWIGKISVESRIEKLKFLLSCPMQYGANESGSKEVGDGIRYIRITDITEENSLKNSEDNMYLPQSLAENYILRDQDVLFARSGGTVGKTFIYEEKYGKCAFAGYLIKAECDKKKLLALFLSYYTQSSIYELWKNSIFIQATIQNIGATKYSNMEMVVHSIEEQKNIVSYLDNKCAKIDKLIALKQSKIEKLQEYKKSLIYEYVTGKKEVI